MSSPKRPASPESPTQTLVTGPSQEEEAQRASTDGDDPGNDGATKFLRVPVQREAAPEAPAAEDMPGATVMLRAGSPFPPPSQTAEPLAPRKGLQVSLPDEEPAPPPPPKRTDPGPLPEEMRGRRGAWWDETAEPIPDEEPPPAPPARVHVPSPDDEKGATAFL